MISRRGFAATLAVGFEAAVGFESARAQRALVNSAPPGTIWLNANEHPDGPCAASVEAMQKALGASGRYHYQEMPDFYATVARSEGFTPSEVLVGAGSSEILHTAIDAFTSPQKPLIVSEPTYEFPGEVARAAGHPVVNVPFRKDHSSDVKQLVETASKTPGALIYLCNPNNPTSAITAKGDLAWLVQNMNSNTVLLVDEAYIHFCTSSDMESAIRYVREGKNVVVARTFSKIYGMAGLRVGFGCAKPELIAKMAPYRNNVVSYVSAKAVVAALGESALAADRRRSMAKTRTELCDWLASKNLRFIPPHANFIMIDVGRESQEVAGKMLQRGVAVGRRFPAMSNMMRVTIGSDREMQKFREVLQDVLQAG